MMIFNLIFYSVFILKYQHEVVSKQNWEEFGVKTLRKLIDENYKFSLVCNYGMRIRKENANQIFILDDTNRQTRKNLPINRIY
jgi:hypothetical protein